MTVFSIPHKAPQYLFGLAMAAGLSVGFAPEAKAESATEIVQCPLDMARRTITNDLPSGWWTTPIVSRLSEVKIRNIGGKPALMCVYGASGSVQRNAPTGKTCQANRARKYFVCRRTHGGGASNPGTFTTGPITIRQTYLADLDRGRETKTGADIWFEAETRTRLYITPRNGAKIAVGNRSNRGYAGCSTASYSSNRVALGRIPVGSYICVKTNQGRISQFRMNRISGGSPKTLNIGYTTWNR